MNSYKVIYEAIDEIRDIMEGRLGAIEERSALGEAEVRAVFGSGSKKVAGCMVSDGMLKKGCLVVVRPPLLLFFVVPAHRRSLHCVLTCTSGSSVERG